MRKKDYLILENDSELSDRFQSYIEQDSFSDNASVKMLGMANQRDTDEIAEEFVQADILLFEPTMITFSQYNMMLMLMYDLITKDTLTINEVQIFTHKDMVKEFTELWEDKRKYLDEVLKYVTLYTINPVGFEKLEIKI